MTDATPALEVPPHVLEFLREHSTLTLATATPAGAPRATSLRYVNDGLTLYVWTRSQSWTATQIEQNPLVSFTITERGRRAAGGRPGSTQWLAGDEVARAMELFAEKFPTALGASTMNISFFRIAPTDVKLVDESYGGGRGETQMFAGAEYHVEEVYNVLSDLPPGDVGAIVGRLQPIPGGGGFGDRAPGRAGGQVRDRRRGRGRRDSRRRRRDRAGDVAGAGRLLRRGGDPARHPRTATLRAVATRRSSPWSETSSAPSWPRRSAPAPTSTASSESGSGEVTGRSRVRGQHGRRLQRRRLPQGAGRVRHRRDRDHDARRSARLRDDRDRLLVGLARPSAGAGVRHSGVRRAPR